MIFALRRSLLDAHSEDEYRVVSFPISYILRPIARALRNLQTLGLGFQTLAAHGGCNA